MAQAGHVHYPRHPHEAWAGGLELFAGVMMIIVGLFQLVVGLSAIMRNAVYVITPGYAFNFDIAAWGWAHLILGILVGLTGIALVSGQTWARVVGMIIVGLSALGNFLFIPYQPMWSLLIIAVEVAVIWALAVHLREVPTSGGGEESQ